MSGWLDAWERWLLAPRPLHALVGARIVFASTLLVAYALRAPVHQDLFGPAGIGGPETFARLPGLPPFHPAIAGPLDLLRSAASAPVVTALYALLLASLAALAVGFRTRVAGGLALSLHLLFWARNPLAFAGWAGFVNGPLAYVVLAPVGRHLSVDAWLRRRQGAAAESWIGPGWPLRLLQIHVCAMYALAGWSRLDQPAWIEGDMVRIALTSASFSRVAIDWSAAAPLLALATWASLALEALAPFLLWVPRVRRVWAAGLAVFHAALVPLLHVEVWAWSAVMIGGLLAFLFRDAEAETTKG